MGLIDGDTVVSLIGSYRLCWISGRFGGGKTLLSYKLAMPYLEKGYRLITNNKSVWADSLQKVDFIYENGIPKLKAVIILDEGGLEFKASKQIEQLAAYARKMDTIFIIPSFFPPTRTAQIVNVQPLFGFSGVGIPLIVYRWRVNLGGFKDSGQIYWWQPSELYGVYDTIDPGADSAEIVSFLLKKTAEFRKLYGHDTLSTLEASSGIDNFEEAVSVLASAADSLSSVIPLQGKRSKKF